MTAATEVPEGGLLPNNLAEEYTRQLDAHVAESSETILHHAYELGRQAIACGTSVLDMAILHHNALSRILQSRSPETHNAVILKASTFFTESMSAFEMLLRRYRESNASLARLYEQELERFAYVAAHDLKSPLRAIDNLSRWLEEDLAPRLDDESRRHMVELRRRVHWMEKLLNDILEYSRAGADVGGTDVISGAELVDEVLKTLDLAGVTVSKAGDLASVRVPLMPLKQVLFNLVDNAIKHSGRKDGIIEVSVEDREVDYLFSVKDNGPGIEKRYHRKIFEMFQTLAPSGSQKGSGIGLALVKKVVSAQGGEVSVESEPGHGALFKFTWPKIRKRENDAG